MVPPLTVFQAQLLLQFSRLPYLPISLPSELFAMETTLTLTTTIVMAPWMRVLLHMT